MNIVSDIAFGARTSKSAGEKPNLDEVLTELEVSQRESDELYVVPAFDALETTVETQPVLKPSAKSTRTAAVDEQPVRAGDDTLKRADEHRKRLENLLKDARHIEEMLAKEAAEARALAEKVNLEEKRAASARAAEAEQQAIRQAHAANQARDAAVLAHAQIADDVRTAREAVEAAAKAVAELQSQLAEAQKLVVQTKLKLRESETGAERAAGVADNAKVEARSAERRIAKCREEREAAEAQLREAEEIAGSVALTTATLERIRALGKTPSK